MTDEPQYLTLDQYRYELQLRHLVWLANQPGAYDYATQRSRELANSDPIYATLPNELWRYLKGKP